MSKKPRVIAPHEFDKVFEADRIRPEDALACTTMPYTRLMMDLGGEGLDFNHWMDMLPIRIAKRGLLGRPRPEYIKQQSRSVVRCNRAWGHSAGLSDVFKNVFPDMASAIPESDTWRIARLGEEYANGEALETETDVTDLVALTTHTRSDDTCLQLGRQLIEGAGSISGLNVVLHQASQRKGVQVMYGGDGFIDYIQDHARYGFDRNGSNDIDHRLPKQFMRMILPLGPYEQEQLASQL